MLFYFFGKLMRIDKFYHEAQVYFSLVVKFQKYVKQETYIIPFSMLKLIQNQIQIDL